MNSLKQLRDCGQSIWLDYIRRDLITSGEFQRLVEQDGVHGVTSNPTIFDEAIAAGTAYDDVLRLLLSADPDRDALILFEKLEIEDLQMAADILRPVYDQTKGADGFVSIEVSPRVAYDTAGSIAEAQRLWKAVNRSNLMVKIPSTVPGIQAVEVLIAEGININITLMFSLAHYEAVAQAYLRGLKQNAKPHQVSSVASFFVSLLQKRTSHRHWCDVVGHYYQCSGEECVCICGLTMNGNDHSECPVELRACDEHESLQSPISEDTLPPGVVEIKFPGDWQHSNQVHCLCGCADIDASHIVGWCLWCDHVCTEYTPAIQDEHSAHHCPDAPSKLKEAALASLAKRIAGEKHKCVQN